MNHIPSPDTSDAGIERLIQAKGKTAPRVTPADIEANIPMTEAQKPALIPIQNIDHFIYLITNWHNNRVAALQHMLSLPAGTEMQVNDTDSVVMDGERLEGFKAGLSLALMELGDLPFVVELEEAPTAH